MTLEPHAQNSGVQNKQANEPLSSEGSGKSWEDVSKGQCKSRLCLRRSLSVTQRTKVDTSTQRRWP